MFMTPVRYKIYLGKLQDAKFIFSRLQSFLLPDTLPLIVEYPERRFFTMRESEIDHAETSWWTPSIVFINSFNKTGKVLFMF